MDKTDQINRLAKRNEKFFLARPKRFGKSLLLSIFSCLFKGEMELFEGLKIESLWKEKPKYDVVTLDFLSTKIFSSIEEFRIEVEALIKNGFGPLGFEYEKGIPQSIYSQLSFWLKQRRTNSLVLLVDDYDSPLTVCLNHPELFFQVMNE